MSTSPCRPSITPEAADEITAKVKAYRDPGAKALVAVESAELRAEALTMAGLINPCQLAQASAVEIRRLMNGLVTAVTTVLTRRPMSKGKSGFVRLERPQ